MKLPKQNTLRNGSKTVEMALVLPLLFLFVMAGVELGRGAMVRNVLEEAARAGCRVAVLQDATSADVINAVQRVLSAADIRTNLIDIQPANLATLAPFETVTVSVRVPYSGVSLFTPQMMGATELSGVCVMPAEIEIDEELNFPKPDTGKKNKKNKNNKNNKTNKKNKKTRKTTAVKRAKRVRPAKRTRNDRVLLDT